MNFTINQPMSEWKFYCAVTPSCWVGTGGGTENGSIEFKYCVWNPNDKVQQRLSIQNSYASDSLSVGAKKTKKKRWQTIDYAAHKLKIYKVEDEAALRKSNGKEFTQCKVPHHHRRAKTIQARLARGRISLFSSVEAMTGFHWHNTTLQRQRRRNVCYVSVLHI